MFGIYLLHCPGNQTWRNDCANRVFQHLGRHPISFVGYKPGQPEFNSEDLPIAPGYEHWSLGHVGCVNGHRSILKYFLNSTDYPFAVIFEDDVTFHGWVKGCHFKEAGMRVSELDPEWDWMQVCNPYNWPSSTPTWIEGTPRKDNIFRCSQISVGSHSYMVSRKGAQKLLNKTSPFKGTFDISLFTIGETDHVYHGPELGCMPCHETDCESIAN